MKVDWPYTEGVAQHSPGLPSFGYPGPWSQQLQASGMHHEPILGANPPRVAAEKMRQPWAMVRNAFGVDPWLSVVMLTVGPAERQHPPHTASEPISSSRRAPARIAHLP